MPSWDITRGYTCIGNRKRLRGPDLLILGELRDINGNSVLEDGGFGDLDCPL